MTAKIILNPHNSKQIKVSSYELLTENLLQKHLLYVSCLWH